MTSVAEGKGIKRTFWAAAFFYFLIAFEFFYMASPFAVYFYSTYRPGLTFFYNNPALAWLVKFFLPHIVIETRNPFINLHNIIGTVLTAGGFLLFSFCAIQVYYSKIAKKGAVLGGIYKYVRHPQYMALAVCGFGLLLLWPRYIMIPIYVTMLFVYYLLARIEEKECIAKFGKSYEEYMDKTGMLLPFTNTFLSRIPRISESRIIRGGVLGILYFLTIIFALGIAGIIQRLSLASLYAVYTENTAYISIVEMEERNIEKLATFISTDEMVKAKLKFDNESQETAYLGYILPADLSVSEIPMNPVEDDDGHHFMGSNYEGSLYRIVMTRAILREGSNAKGKNIVINTIKTEPLVEVMVDIRNGAVIRIDDPAVEENYEGVPLPIY